MILLLLHLQQAVAGGPDRAPRDRLDRAVATLGGLERIAGLDRWLVAGEGRENLTAELQGRAPDAPTWRPHLERVAVVTGAGRVAWERRTPRNDQSLRWRRFILGADSSGVVDWVGGFAAMRPSPASPTARAALARRIPHLLLAEIASTGGPLERGAGRGIVATLGDGTRIQLAFDRADRLVSAEYRARLPGIGETPVRWSWSGWRPDSSLDWAPSGHRIAVGGITYQEVRYTSYRAGSDSAAALVRLPPDPARFASHSAMSGFPSVAPAGDPAPGVRLLDVRGFRVLLIEESDHLILIEAPEQHPGLEAIPAGGAESYGAVTAELKRRIGEIAPGKPLRYVVVTHHHDDHLGGLGGLATAATTVLVGSAHQRAALRALAASPLADSSGGRARVQVIRDRITLGHGPRRLEIIAVGDNPHTTASLVAWLPEPRIIFQGDLFYFDANGAFPPSGRGTMNRFFAGWLRRSRLEPVAIYGVHFTGAAGPEAVAASLRWSPPPAERATSAPRSGTRDRSRGLAARDPRSSRGTTPDPSLP